MKLAIAAALPIMPVAQLGIKNKCRETPGKAGRDDLARIDEIEILDALADGFIYRRQTEEMM